MRAKGDSWYLSPVDFAAIQEALEPVARMLSVEDYHLSVSQKDDAVLLGIAAGDGACSYCLVSKPTLRSIALSHLEKAGLSSDLELEITYPDDAPPDP